jgi:geranylgeranyl diphosphate synthase type II
MSFEEFFESARAAVDAELSRALPSEDAEPAILHRAMRYAVFGPGKRLRPALVLAACGAAGGREKDALPGAAAVELVHTYSLVHDDLPCMDDDELRRGRPTCHKAFGEATAVLAGDALLTLAFEWVARESRDAEAARSSVAVLSRAAGSLGMVGGQQLDLLGERELPSEARTAAIHRLKTAELMAASLELGAVAAGAPPPLREGLAEFGRTIGLAFQIVDDCLDATSTSEQLGKSAGRDAVAGKQTWPACKGVEESLREADSLRDSACAKLRSIKGVDSGLALLQDFALFVVARRS